MKRIIIICALVSLIPIGIIGGGICWTVLRTVKFEKYKAIKGEIVELDTKKKGKFDVAGDVAYYPKIIYYDDNNEPHELVLKIGSNPPIGPKWSRIDLLVNPENPEDVVIDSYFYKWFGPTVILIIGFVLLAFVGIVSLTVIINKRKRKKNVM